MPKAKPVTRQPSLHSHRESAPFSTIFLLPHLAARTRRRPYCRRPRCRAGSSCSRPSYSSSVLPFRHRRRQMRRDGRSLLQFRRRLPHPMRLPRLPPRRVRRLRQPAVGHALRRRRRFSTHGRSPLDHRVSPGTLGRFHRRTKRLAPARSSSSFSPGRRPSRRRFSGPASRC